MTTFIRILIPLTWLLSLVSAYIYERENTENELRYSLQFNAKKVSQIIDLSLAYTHSTEQQIETHLAFLHSERLAHPLIERIELDAGDNFYHLTLSPERRAVLVGQGDINAQRKELSAVLLTNFAMPIKAAKNQPLWAYYASESGFLYLHPNDNVKTEADYQRLLNKLAHFNQHTYSDKQEVVIVGPKGDVWGEEGLVSVSAPVIYKNHLYGHVSLAVHADFFSSLLNSGPLELEPFLALTTQHGEVVATSHSTPSTLEHVSVDYPAESMMFMGDKAFIRSKTIFDEFVVLYSGTKSGFYRYVLKQSRHNMLLASLAFLLILIGAELTLRLLSTRQVARFDGLTQILNRHSLEKSASAAINESIRKAQPLSVVVIDIDHFKRINDTYGHSVGDKGLVHLTDLVKQHIRKSDIFGRYGGEEFVLVLPQTDICGAMVMADKLRTLVACSSFAEGIHFTISLGCAQLSDVGKKAHFSHLFKCADTALYEAKHSGRNRAVQYSERIRSI